MATPKKSLALSEYTASGKGIRRPGTQCWVCGLPERKEIDAALHGDPRTASAAIIRRWLIDERGYDPADVTLHKIQHHKDAGHHDRP